MARRSKSKSTRRQPKLNIIHTRAAGIDVGSTFHVVAVPPELSPEPVQPFQSFTGDLYRLADWLVEIGVTTVAMESTGIYWIPVFAILEAHGLEVLLVNARHVNPMKIEVPRGRVLEGRLLADFHKERKRIDDLMRRSPVKTRVAEISE